MKRIFHSITLILALVIAILATPVKWYWNKLTQPGMLTKMTAAMPMTVQATEKMKIVGCLAPIDKAGNAWVGKPIDMATCNRVAFIIYVGAEDSTGAITVEKGTSSSLGTAIAYNYRIASTGAAAFSVLDGALTAVASTGYSLAGTDDNKIMVIEVLAAELGSSNWVGVKVAANGSANLVTIIALCHDERFPQAVPPDPTT